MYVLVCLSVFVYVSTFPMHSKSVRTECENFPSHLLRFLFNHPLHKVSG